MNCRCQLFRMIHERRKLRYWELGPYYTHQSPINVTIKVGRAGRSLGLNSSIFRNCFHLDPLNTMGTNSCRKWNFWSRTYIYVFCFQSLPMGTNSCPKCIKLAQILNTKQLASICVIEWFFGRSLLHLVNTISNTYKKVLRTLEKLSRSIYRPAVPNARVNRLGILRVVTH